MSESSHPVVVMQQAVAPMVVRNERAFAVAFGQLRRTSVVRQGFAGPQGIPGPAGAAATINAIAASNMTYPTVVAIVNGVAHPADPTNTADMVSQLAVTTQAAVAGANVVCAAQTSITETAWNWAPGRIYLSTAGGGLTQSPGATGAILEVGRAVTPTTIDFDIQTAILR